DVRDFGFKLDEMTERVGRALAAGKRTRDSDVLLEESRDLEKKVRAAIQVYEEHTLVLDTLIARTEKAKPTSDTLENVLKEVTLDQGDDRAKQLVLDQKKADEEAELERQRKQQEAEKLLKAKEALVAEFDKAYPEIAAYLKPFTLHGTSQPNGFRFRPTAK